MDGHLVVKKILLLAAYLLSPVILIAAIYNSNPGYYGTTGLIPMILGATAFTVLSFQMLLSARPKWLDKVFGLDRIFQFHILVAVLAILAVIIHKIIRGAVFKASLKTTIGDIAMIVFIVCAVLALLLLTEILSSRIKPVRAFRKYLVEKMIGNYHLQLILHNINAAAAVLVFVHVMISFSARNVLVRLLYILYFGVAVSFYVYHKILRRYVFRKTYIIDRVVRESRSMTTLELHPEEGPAISFLPGQFGFLRIQDPSVSIEEHPFSFSSQPGSETLTITIKNLGDWTACVHAVKPGSKVWFDAPYGRFSPLLYHCEDGIVLIAGGVGITPMLSILRHHHANARNQKILLFWGVNKKDELICSDELKLFQKEMPHFTFIPVLAAEEEWVGEKGYITKELLFRIINENGLEIQKLHYFFCGPAPMWPPVYKSLKSMNINRRMIHYEKFAL